MANGEFKSCSDRPARSNADEDDDQPYAVGSEPVAPVKEADDEYLPPLARTWDTFWPLNRRVTVFAVMLALNVVLLPFSALIVESIITIAVTLIVNSLIQAFVLGTFERVEIKRSPVGKIVLMRTWRIAFYPLAARRVRWREFESVSCRMSHESHFEDWIVAVILFPYGLIPAVLWYWFVIRPDRMLVSLCKDHDFPDTVLFRSWNQAQAEDVAKTVANVTGRPWK